MLKQMGDGPDLEGLWTCLRVMNELVVLIVELPKIYSWYEEGIEEVCKCSAHGGIVKVFHMPTKVWHTFPEDRHVIIYFGLCSTFSILDPQPFVAEIKFDAIP